MANDINLPNLVSHLAVNLDGLSGTVADAERQGSSIGAALGGGIQRELRDLVAHLPEVQIDGNSSQLDRDLARVRSEMEELSNKRIGVDISIEEALRRVNELQPHIQRLSDEHPDINVRASTRQAAAQLDGLLAAARRVDDTDVDVDVHVDEHRLNRVHGLLGKLGTSLGSLGGLGASIGRVAAGIGTVIPAAASVVTTLENVAPAAGVAVTGLAAVQLASGTVKLAAVGMKDALTNALDPSKADKYAESLKKLSPEARKFAESVHDAAPALQKMQQSVQDTVFKGLADQLERTGRSVLPVLRTNLQTTAGALNTMGSGVLTAARDLGESGTLGKALGSASKGLTNLSGIPAIVVTALGQIGAAAGPSFESLTKGAAGAAKTIGDRLSKSFESGAMQKSIEHAIDLLKDLASVGGNVVTIIGNVFNAVPPGGGGLIGILKDVSGALADITASPEVQSGLTAIFETMGTLGRTVAPLLAQALSAIGPVFATLGPPVQTLVTALGEGLSPIIVGLGPVLQSAAGALGALVTAVSPLLPVIGQLVASLLPAVTPLFDALTTVFMALAPVVEQVGGILQDTLSPIIAQLPAIIEPLAQILATNLVVWLQILGDLLVQLGPSLVQMGQSFADLLVAAAPLIEIIASLTTGILSGLLPAITPIIQIVAAFASVLADILSGAINNVVIPALQALTALLHGDVTGAANATISLFQGLVSTVVALFIAFPVQVASAVSPLPGKLASAAQSAGSQLVSTVGRYIGEAVALIQSLPGRAASALGGLGGVLISAGSSLISGFISGIRSMIPSVHSVLSALTNSLPSWKGPKAKDAKILTPAGQALIEGFIKGIDGTTAKLRSRLAQITKALPANTKSGIGKALAKSTKELEKLVTKRDAVIKKLDAAEKKLTDLTKAKAKAASDIRSGILQEANITSGHADVNSVSAITVELQQALKKTKEFQANIAKLKAAGLRSDLLQQIADAGVEGGAATAAALANATPEELKKINDLQGQLDKSATSTGNTVGDALYGAGIKAAQGLVKGLRSQQKAIEAEMERIAEAMLKAVKKKHKTHSPSVAFAEIGEMDMEGWRVGLLARAHKVIGAASDVAGRALEAASGAVGGALSMAPTAGQLTAAYAPAAPGGGTYHTWNLYGSDATPAGIVRELSWLGLVGRR